MTENKQEKVEIRFSIEQTFGSEKDIADLIQIEDLVVEDLKKQNKSKIYSATSTREEWIHEFQNNCKVYFIVLDGKRIGSLVFEEQKNGDELYIGGVAMLPEYQGKGITKKALAEKMDELMKIKKYKRVYLLTHRENPAKKLYESLGFFDTGESIENYDGAESRIIMNLKLN